MELAENVGGKRSSYFKPDALDSKFRETSCPVNENAKSRLRGYLTTFAYVIFCGLLLLIGGGTFFIYESTVIEEIPDAQEKQPSGRMASAPESSFIENKGVMAKEFQIVAFVFIGVGALMLVIGAPLATQFYRRYRAAKDTERSPILDPKEKESKKSKIYNPPAPKQSENSSNKSAKKKKVFRGKKKSGWMYKKQKSISKEGFRFAAHRHPSMNQITIDGAVFFDRRSSDNSSTGSTDEETPEVNIPEQTKKKTRFGNFLGKIFRFGIKTRVSEKELKESSAEDKGKLPPFFESTEEVPSTSAGTSLNQHGYHSNKSPSQHTYNDNLAFEPENETPSSGLYNLGQ